MKYTVLADPGLQHLSDRFTWLSIDTELPTNAKVLEQFPPLAWPTFYVISPNREKVVARFLEAASLPQFRDFILDGERAWLKSKTPTASRNPPDSLDLLLEGDRKAENNDHEGAYQAYEQALKAAPPNWSRSSELWIVQLQTLWSAKQFERCTQRAHELAPDLPANPTSTRFLYLAKACADQSSLESSTPFLSVGRERAIQIFEEEHAYLSADDRSELMRIAREYSLALQQTDKARHFAMRQQELLDDAAHHAPDPYAASAYNWPRAEVYVFLEQGEVLLPELIASEKALPGNYDPPYRVAWLLFQLKRFDQALAAAQRSMALAQGPRKERIKKLIEEITAQIPN